MLVLVSEDIIFYAYSMFMSLVKTSLEVPMSQKQKVSALPNTPSLGFTAPCLLLGSGQIQLEGEHKSTPLFK